jgi:hypothetical protein
MQKAVSIQGRGGFLAFYTEGAAPNESDPRSVLLN